MTIDDETGRVFVVRCGAVTVCGNDLETGVRMYVHLSSRQFVSYW